MYKECLMNRTKIIVMHLRSSAGNGGGPEKTILNSPLYIDKSKYELFIVYLKKKADKHFKIALRAKELGLDNFYMVEEGSYFDKQAMLEVATLIDRLKVDILHTHDYKSDWWGWLIRKDRPNLRLVTTVHGWTVMSTLRERFYYQIGKFPLYLFDRIIAVNEEIIRSLRIIGVPQRKISLIRNAVDSNAYRRQTALRNNGRTIGYIGRLSKEKRVEDLIFAFAKLSKEARVDQLLIAGEGPKSDDLRFLVSKLNLYNRVKFLGYVDSKSFFNEVDIFVNPSLREGLPNTILESMAMKVAVVATKVGGVGDLVRHGRTGFLIPGKKPDKIYETVKFLLDNPEECSVVTKNARDMVCNLYDFTKRMRHVEQVYDDVFRHESSKEN